MNDATELATNGTTILVLNMIAAAIKNLTPIDNRWIPIFLFVAGAALNCMWLGVWSGKEIVDGLMIGGTAIGLHQAAINTKPNPTPPAP